METETEQPKGKKSEPLFEVVFRRKVANREERTVLGNRLRHADAVALRDAHATIANRKTEKLNAQLHEAELAADDKLIRQIKAQISAVMGKTEDSTFILRLDADANTQHLKAVPLVLPKDEEESPAASKRAKADKGAAE